MYSDQFTVAVNGKQTRWRLKMYPNGRKPVDQGYVTLFLKDSGRLDASVIINDRKLIYFIQGLV